MGSEPDFVGGSDESPCPLAEIGADPEASPRNRECVQRLRDEMLPVGWIERSDRFAGSESGRAQHARRVQARDGLQQIHRTLRAGAGYPEAAGFAALNPPYAGQIRGDHSGADAFCAGTAG